MANMFDPDAYFHTEEWRNAVDPSKNHYERIGLRYGVNYSANDIRNSFQKRYDWWREVNKRYNANPANPKTKETGPVSKEAMEKLHHAYDILSNPSKKMEYDKQLEYEHKKKNKEDFSKMIRIVLADNVLTQEGEKILFHYAEVLRINQAEAAVMITSEVKRSGTHCKSSLPITAVPPPEGPTVDLPDHYNILEIDAVASNEQIKDAYKKKLDLWNGLSSDYRFKEMAQRRKQTLREAVDTLLDNKRRREYDKKLFGKRNLPRPANKHKKNKTIAVALSGVSIVFISIMIIIVLYKGRTYQPGKIVPKPIFQKKAKHSPISANDTEIVMPGWLGVDMQDIDPDLAEAFHVNTTEGVLISEVKDNSPAREAGLTSGDILIEYDGTPLHHSNHLRFLIDETEAGKEIEIKILRKGEEMTLNAKIGQQPPVTTYDAPKTIPKEKDIGIIAKNPTKEFMKQYSIEEKYGVLVSKVKKGSPAFLSGIEEGDFITEINRKKINSVVQFKKALIEAEIGAKVLLHIKRGKLSLYMTIDPMKTDK